MNIWVISQLQASLGNQRFLDAAHRAGHSAELVHPLDLDLLVSTGAGFGIRYRGVSKDLPDLAFTRMGATSPPACLNTLLQLQALGIPVINDPRALWLTRDKVRCSLTLARAGLAIPRMVIPGRDFKMDCIVEQLGPAPWVVKLAEGCKGEAVFLVHDEAELRRYTDAAVQTEVPLLVQRFVAESSGVDLRVLVAGGSVLGAMRRRSSTGDFRSNLHQGGTGEPVNASPAVEHLALSAVAILGLDVAGVDVLESNQGPLLIEVNGSPGLAGIGDATQTDVGGAVVAYLERSKATLSRHT
ncbi:MAG: ribosomal protein S6--L-glutamate ligase [Planctomycetota bacterium]|jgi:ribosomal protein S6--L-glutamate ligase